MKTKELQLIKDLNLKYDRGLKPTENEYEAYDAYNDISIIEIKVRDVVYNTHYVQVDKFYNLLMIGEALEKKPFYLVKDSSGVYLYDLKIRMLYSERKHNTSEENKTARG